MKAIIIGANTSVGKDLLRTLLEDTDYSKVVAFVHSPTGLIHLKLSEVITNFDRLEDLVEHVRADILFFCTGTNPNVAESKEKRWHKDFEIPFRFAEIAKKNSVTSAVLLSVNGASVESRSFQKKLKGMLEEAIDALAFEQYIIFRTTVGLHNITGGITGRLCPGLLHFLTRVGFYNKNLLFPDSGLVSKLADAAKVLNQGKHIIQLDEMLRW